MKIRLTNTNTTHEPIIGIWTTKIQDGGDRELVKSPYLAEKSSDFDEIWNTTAHLELDDSQRTKYEHF